MDSLLLIGALLIGTLLGFFFSISRARRELAADKEKFVEIKSELSASEALAKERESRVLALQEELDKARERIDLAKEELAKASADKAALETVQAKAKVEFENLSRKLLEAQSRSFSEQTEKNLGILLNPLGEKIQSFSKTVDEKYGHEAKERHALKSEIERLIKLNNQMKEDANSLTRALKGDSKIQGNWGELVLKKILESSGLQEGREYQSQPHYKGQEGERLHPDVVIKLPEDKHVVIDSKVSLKDYELYCSNEDESNLRNHLKSIEKHVKDLSDKDYSQLQGVRSPDFVFMFIPIEPAYMLAMQNNPTLFEKAWEKKIAIVTATTLLASLKTIASIWRVEKQNQNALEIAKEGANLYDKFVGFLEDFKKVGQTFETGQKHYHSALNKLKGGKGNVIRRTERLRELGVASNKKIPQEFLDS